MIGVVVPCYRVRRHILGVLERVGKECDRIYVVDDACPDGTGAFVREHCPDPRVRVLSHERNRGVGGATLTGYRAALADGAAILVKLDGDGQMDPAWIPRLVAPIRSGEADYTKGNRFYDPDRMKAMPRVRLVGNAVLSFLSKLSSGYWNLFDPTNGFTALHASVAARLPLHKIDEGYFFESDMLFRLNTIRAVIRDVPMEPVYKDEQSHLVIWKEAGRFLGRHVLNTGKRILYNYYLRNFSVASIELASGAALVATGTGIGTAAWIRSIQTGIPATSGTVMLAALPILLGVQLLLAFLMYDAQDVPREALHRHFE